MSKNGTLENKRNKLITSCVIKGGNFLLVTQQPYASGAMRT